MDDVIKMSTNNGKKGGRRQEHHQRVQSSSESGQGFKCMKWDKDEYIRVPYSPLLAEYDPGRRRQ